MCIKTYHTTRAGHHKTIILGESEEITTYLQDTLQSPADTPKELLKELKRKLHTQASIKSQENKYIIEINGRYDLSVAPEVI
jgi:translation initiation factor 1 (eIF-1/SUI1)